MALPITSPSLVSDPQGDLDALAAQLKPQDDNLVKKLSEHISSVWTMNQKDNKPIRQQMIELARRSRGEYDQAKLALIRAFGGCETFIRSGENKARCAESWIKDIYRGTTDPIFECEPTAVPDLPDETQQLIEEQTRQQAAVIEQQIMASGMVPDPQQVAQLMNDYYQEMLDKARQDNTDEAKERCKRAQKLILDQNQEGGWNDTFKDFLYYLARMKTAVIRGPVLSRRKKQEWQVGADGYELGTVDALVYTSYACSPFNFFPSKGMKCCNDGDIIELHEMTKQSISELIGVPGYSEKEIRAVLDEYKGGSLKAKWFTLDDETAVKQVTKDKTNLTNTTPPTQNTTDLSSELIWAQEFSGTVSGAALKEWMQAAQTPEEYVEGTIPDQLDDAIQYKVNAWKIGKHIIKAVLNPDNLGRNGYHATSWAKNPEWIWGEGLLGFAAPVEDAINALVRATINNAAIGSGPVCEYDKDRVDGLKGIFPWMTIASTSMQMKGDGKAIEFYQPMMHLQELIMAIQFFMKLLDEMTVPAYAQGASQAGVTAGTATVFTQLLAAASRSIKAVVANIDDDIITPYIQMCYDFNMKFTDDDSIKGDARIVAKGVMGLLAKEQSTQRKIEALTMITAPVIAQILGAKNIGAVVAQVLKGQDITLPDMDRLDGNETAEMQVQAILNAQAGVQMGPDPNNPMQANGQVAAGGGQVAQGQGLLPDGQGKAGIVNG